MKANDLLNYVFMQNSESYASLKKFPTTTLDDKAKMQPKYRRQIYTKFGALNVVVKTQVKFTMFYVLD